jgi:AraC-like DNA-binding protein
MQDYEFIWILEGSAVIHFGRNKIYAKAGTVLLRRPGVTDYYEWSTLQRTVHAYIHFQLDKDRVDHLTKLKVPTVRVMPPNDIIRPLFGYLLNLEKLNETNRFVLMLPALDLLFKSFITGQVLVRAQEPFSIPEPLKKVVDFIIKNVSQTPPARVRLSDLAQVANTTPETLCRMFKKSMDLSPIEYTKLARLARAANSLRRTSQSLKEIALSLGFCDAFHLSRSFKEIYGLSPKAFRKYEYNEWLTQKNQIFQTIYCNINPSYLKLVDDHFQPIERIPKKKLF